MMMNWDMELVREYAARHSEEAFATLVSQHVNLVYSVALRRLRDTHLAEEATQAVFIILARKAGALGPKTILPAWLCRTAQYAAADALRAKRRRQNREQEAYMQSSLNEPDAESAPWIEIAPLLDVAMARLGEKDHNAIVLRFFEGRDLKQVGAALGVSENTAKTRVSRALERLRQFFLKRGVTLSAAVIAGAVSENSIQAAPVALAKTATAMALGKGAVASVSTLALAKAILTTMKTKTIVATTVIAVTIFGLGAGVYMVHRSKTAHVVLHPTDAVPLKLANDSFYDPAKDRLSAMFGMRNSNSDKFLNELDTNTRRTADSGPAGHIKCLVAPTAAGSRDYLDSLPSTFAPGLTTSRDIRHFIGEDSALYGKRIRISGWMKTKDVRNWAGASLLVANIGGHIFSSDNMFDRPLAGTTGWEEVEFVTDIPKEPCVILLRPTLYGTGEMWCDDFQIDTVPSATPVTDDRRWTVWTQHPNDYAETIDTNEMHNGHPSRRISYVSTDSPHKQAFVWWGIHNRDLNTFSKFLGHKVRISAWTKSADISDRCGLDFEPKGPGGNELAKQAGWNQIPRTSDWALRSVTCFVPKETQDFQTAFYMRGSGTLWIDQESFKAEIVK